MRHAIRPVLTILSIIGLLAVASRPATAQSGSRSAPSTGSSNRAVAPGGSGQRGQTQASLALEGYCPVSLQQMNKWVKGNPAIQATFDGHTYYFANQEGKQGPCLERNQAVIYRGPFKQVEDDDNHVYYRGQRMAVCDKTFHLLQKSPYAHQFEFMEPLEAVPVEQAARFDCSRATHRHPRETKGLEYDATTQSRGMCTDSGGSCC